MVIFKTFISSFYKSNAGFFLFFFFLFFGTVNGSMLLSYHLSLIQSIISSVAVAAGVLFLWLLYHIKCVRFCMQVLQSPQGSFLTNLQAYSNVKQLGVFGIVHLLLYLPVFIYACVVVTVALQQQRWAMALILGICQILMLLSGPLIYSHSINNTFRENRLVLLTKFTGKKPKAFTHILLHYLRHQKWMAVLAIKTFSALLLYVMFLNGKDTGHDYLVLVFLVILLGHIKLPFQLTGFMENGLSFHRNLPLAVSRIAWIYLYTYAILLLPEACFLLVKSRGIFAVQDVVAFYLFGVFTFFLLTAILYNDAMNMNEYTKVVFGLFFISVFGLYSRNYIWLIGAEIIIGVVLFRNGYERYTGAKLE
jgi:hypothetical protein